MKEHTECLEERKANEQQSKKKKDSSAQPTINLMIERVQPYSNESAKKKKIDDALIEMICVDMQPTSIVEDKGFKKFLAVIDSRYQPPSRLTITRANLPKKYDNIREKVQKDLETATSIALTTDMWTSLQKKSYRCVTAHLINEEWELKSYLLETFDFCTSHTAAHISSELQRVAGNWKISDKIICVVTDNASNKYYGFWYYCNWLATFAVLRPFTQHCVHTSIEKDLKATEVQTKCKNVVSHFHRSVKSTEKLTEIQQQLSLPNHKLKQDVSTRWNSTYIMFERFLEQFDAITTTLFLVNQNHLCLNADNKNTISNALDVLKPFLEATENASGQDYVSVSLIVPLAKLLQQQCSMSRQSQSNNSSTLATSLHSELISRFCTIETHYVTAVTTLLDPRFKKLPFSDKTPLSHTINRLTNELSSLPDDTDDSSLTTADASSTSQGDGNNKQSSASSLWDSFDKKVAESSSHRTSTIEATIEVRRYFEEGNIERKKDPLQWWKQHHKRFPRLQVLAHRYLCIPGSSVPSERLFSKAGILVSERRNRLKPKNVDQILFLNQNL